MKVYRSSAMQRFLTALVCAALLLGGVVPAWAAPAPAVVKAVAPAPVLRPPATYATGPYTCSNWAAGSRSNCYADVTAQSTSILGVYYTISGQGLIGGVKCNDIWSPNVCGPAAAWDLSNNYNSSGTGTFCVDSAPTGSCNAILGAGNWTGTNQGTGLAWWSGSAGTTVRAVFQCWGGTCSNGFQFYLIWSGSPTATPTNTATPVGGGSSRIDDGNMESKQPWVFWQFEGGENFGRYVANPLADLYFGASASCGVGYEVLGGSLFGSNHPTAIKQSFVWIGGDAHVSYSGRGDRYSAAHGSYIDAYLINLGTGVNYALQSNAFYSSAAWSRQNITLAALPAGTYELNFQISPQVYGQSAPDWFMLDDVWVDHFDRSYCDQGQPTATPSATPSPSPTRTPTRTRTPTGTLISPTPSRTPTTGPTATPYSQGLNNCGFELGSTGWSGQGYTIALAGGPIGPQYASLLNSASTIGQSVFWNTQGAAYLTFWIGPQSYGEVTFLKSAGGQSYSAWVGSNVTNNWVQVKVSRLLPAGSYTLQARSYATLKLDGVALGRNGYVYCGTGTPTAGPTAYVTATASRTATTGPTPTGTQSPVPSVTRTPNPSGTAAATYTPRPTTTPQPTSTQSSAEKTATAAGTTVPTYTPPPSTTPGGGGGGGGTGCDQTQTDCPVPEQPEPAPNATCVRPQYFWQVAQWVDYSRCEVLKYFAWSPENSQQLVDLGEEANDYEPFGTISETVGSIEAVQFVIDQYDWVDTGYTGAFDVERPELVTLSLSALADPVNFAFDAGANAILQVEINFCRGRLLSVFSSNVAHGVCVVWAFLHGTGIIAWIQFFFDLACWLVLVRYIWKRFLG